MKNLKKAVRVLLLLGCIVYLVLFVKDLESILDYQKLSGIQQEPKLWFWLFFGEFLPVVSLAFATVYAFSKRLWKMRWALTVAVALMCIMLAFSDVLHINETYVALYPAVALLAGAIYITCVYAVKALYRRYIAAGTLAVLLIAYCVAGGIDNSVYIAFNWSLRYAGPLIPLGLLGLILPERYD